jgi:phage terminase large subunit-like protein
VNGELFGTLINAGIAGVFAVFAILLFREGSKTLHATQEMFVKFLEAEREQRSKIMIEANQNMQELTDAVQKANIDSSIADQLQKEGLAAILADRTRIEKSAQRKTRPRNSTA